MLFLLPPEKAHGLTMALFSLFASIPGVKFIIKKVLTVEHEALKRTLWGIDFPNPVGLAAGFDKEGKYIDELSCLGFGFIEIGTITPRPQEGNPKPRLFRLHTDLALLNRMGFNNGGMEEVALRLSKHRKQGIILGGNIGKNKTTPNEQAAEDYLACFHTLFQYVDYFVVNVSSPNTAALRELQDKEPLARLLHGLMEANIAQSKPKPILLKIAPDLTEHQLDDIVDIVQQTGIHGIIATNTTVDRSKLRTNTKDLGLGGISGAPVRERSTEIIRYLFQRSGGTIPIIGVGGIDSPEAAMEKLQAGASLVQVYTGMVYEGPGLVRRINKKLIHYFK